jgi:hypothetical protein
MRGPWSEFVKTSNNDKILCIFPLIKHLYIDVRMLQICITIKKTCIIMKKILMISAVATALLTSVAGVAQDDKSKRPSPPATATATTASGNVITIEYSQPSVKGRQFGTAIAPYGKVWRTGANEATTFEISKDARIEGKYPLKAGKYSIYSIPGEQKWTVIFNKTWKQWGTQYTEADDALRVELDTKKAPSFTEKMTFQVSKDGLVTLMWADRAVSFTVK